MKKRNVISVGFSIPGTEIKYESLNSEISLLDYDIAIIDPSISDFYDYNYESYLGKRCLGDTRSFQLKEHMSHWRSEINDFVNAGKTLFIMLSQEDSIYVATGTKSHSGTGKNRQTTRHVELTSNYKMIPIKGDFKNSNGSIMALIGKDNVLSSYWKTFSEIAEYVVHFTNDEIIPLIKTKTGNRIVGGQLQLEKLNGNMFLLPYINFDKEEYSYENDDGEEFWTEKAEQLGKKFIYSLCSIDETIKKTGLNSVEPDWLSQDKYSLPKEKVIKDELSSIENDIMKLNDEKEEKMKLLKFESLPKKLLYETGKSLEEAVRDSLGIIGFNVTHLETDNSEFDVVFESDEGRLIGEVEGKDNKAINVTKLRQLEMNILEDFDRDEICEMAKGALIGNAYRLQEPDQRPDFFTNKCLTAVKRTGTALIRSTDLFNIVNYMSEKDDEKFSKECRKAILEATGIVEFPMIHQNEEVITKSNK